MVGSIDSDLTWIVSGLFPSVSFCVFKLGTGITEVLCRSVSNGCVLKTGRVQRMTRRSDSAPRSGQG